MDINRWKFILFEWIKSTDLIDATGSLEHIDLEKFYEKLTNKISHDKNYKKENAVEFLKEYFPSYEILFCDTNSISPQDYVYIFSILLYHSCVQKSNEFFQKSCKNLDPKHQISIARFFGFIKASTDKDKHARMTKELLRQAIKEACPLSQSPHLNFMSVGSPLRTPKCNKSPSTPNKEMYNEKMRELKHIKAQLENERYEKNMLEVEVKQNQEKAESLAQKCKLLTHEVQTLKTELLVERESENFSPNRNQREAQIRSKMQKEINSREDKIVDLKCEIENLASTNEKFQNKISVMEREISEMRNKIANLDTMVEEMQGNLDIKDEKIQQLEEVNRELLEIINENRHFNEKEGSLDYSYYASHTLGLNASEGGESIAKGVVDLQLKEKEVENHALNEKIENLEKKIEENFTEIQKLQREKTEKLKEIEFLGEDLRVLQAKNQEIQTQFEAEKKMSAKFSAENTKLRHGIENSQILVENLQKDIKKIYAEAEKGKLEVHAAKEAQKQSAEQFKSEKLKSEELSAQVSMLTTEIASLKSENTQKVLELSSKILKLEEIYKKSLDSLKSLSDDKLLLETTHKVDCMKLKEKHAKEIEQICASKDKIIVKMEESLKGKLRESEMFHKSMQESLQSKINRANRQIEELQKNIKGQEINISSLEELVRNVEQEKLELTQKLQEKEEGIKTIESENNEKFKEMTEKNLNLQKEVDEVSEKVQEVLKELKLKDEKILKLDNERSALKIELQYINDVKDKLGEELTQEKKNMVEKEQLLKETEENLANIQENMSKTEALLAEFKTNLAATQVNLTKTETALVETQESLCKNVKILEGTQEKLLTTETNLAETQKNLQTSTENFKSEIKQITLELNLKISEISVLKDEKIEMEKSYQEKLAEISNNNAQNVNKMTQDFSAIEAKFNEKIHQLEMEISVANEKITTLTNDKSNLISKFESTQSELEGLKAQKYQLDSEYSKLREINNSIKNELSRSHSELTHLQNVISEKELIIENMEFEKTFALESKESLVRQKAICDNEIQELKTQISHKDKKISDYELDIDVKTMKIENSEKFIENLKTQIKEFNSQVDRLKQEIEKLQRTKNENETLIEAQNVNIDDLRDEKSKAEFSLTTKIAEIEDLNEKIVNLRNDLSHKDSQIIENEEKIRKITAELDDTQEALSETKLSFEELQTRFNTLREDSGNDLSKKIAEISDLKSENSGLNKKIENMTNNSNHEKLELLEKLKIESEKLQAALEEAAEHKLIIDELQNNISHLNEQKNKADQGIIKFKAEINLLYGKINEISENVKVWQTENEVMNVELTKAIKMACEKIKENDELNEEIKNNNEKLKSYEENVVKMEQELDVFRSKLESSEQDLEKTVEKLKIYEESLKAAQVSQKESEESLISSQDQVELLTKYKEITQNQLKTLEESLKASKKYSNDLVDIVRSSETELQITEDNLKVANKRIEELQRTVRDWDQKLKDSQTISQEKLQISEIQLKNVNENLTKSEKEMRNLQQNLERSEKKIKELEEELIKSDEELKKYEAKSTKLEEEIIQKSNEIISLTSHESNITAEKLKLMEQNSKLVEDNNELKSNLDIETSSFSAEKEALKAEQTKLQDEVIQLNEKIQKSLENLSLANTKVSDLQKEKDSLSYQVHQLEEKLKEQIAKNTEASNDMKAFNEDMEFRLNEKDSEVKELKVQISTMSEKIDSMKTQLSDYEDQVNLKDNKIDKLEDRLTVKNNIISDLENRLKSSEDQVLGLENHATLMKEELNSLKMQTETLELKISSTESQVSEKDNQLADLDFKIIEMDDKLLYSKNKLEETTAQISNLETQLSEMKNQLSENQIQLKEKQEQIDNQEKLLAEKNVEVNQYLEENVVLRNRVNEIEEQIQKNNCLLEEKDGQIKEKESKLMKLEDQVKNFESQVTVTTSQNTELLRKISEQDIQLQEKESKVLEMLQQIDELKVTFRGQIESLEVQLEANKDQNKNENSKIQELLKKLKDHSALEQRLKELEALHAREKVFNDKMNEDQKILAAKLMKARKDYEDGQKMWNEEKEKMMLGMQEEKAKFEEGKKEVRLEMEGKLEKMKEKMKSLYSEEMTKKTQKYEEKLQEFRTEHQFLNRKNDEHEAQIDRLTKQILTFKDLKIKYDEAIRENEFMRSKLRFMEKNGGMTMSGSIGMSRMPSTTPRLNLAGTQMEDEAGEEFNNTYLKDLKFGSDFSLDKPVNDVCSASVLQQRNSMYPQHMRDSYAVINLDRNVGEEEMKYGGVNLDDSDALLLQNQQRKKQSTSYKRPGPPTPSKNAGRLSIGAPSDIHYTNILKETGNIDNAGKKQTPGRVMAFLSHFSKNKDEKSSILSNKKSQKPPKVKNVAWIIDGESNRNDSLSGPLFTKELNRMERRNDARDNNRQLNFDDTVVVGNDDEEYEFMEGSDSSQERKKDAKAFSKLNDSIKQKRSHEEFLKKQQKTRTRRFSLNRRRSKDQD